MSETLVIKKNNAIQAYFNADAEMKKVLANLFGEEILSQKITDIIKTFEDVCKMQNKKADDVIPFKNSFATQDQTACNLLVQMRMINRALCEDWLADYSDDDEKKWRPWFKWNASSSCFRFYRSDYGSAAAFAGSGVRLVFPTKELSDYFGTQFEKLNSDYLLTQ
jgi:hypothetical protein